MSRSPADVWRHRLSDLHTWKRGAQRAVHKPLLMLMLLARADASLPGAAGICNHGPRMAPVARNEDRLHR